MTVGTSRNPGGLSRIIWPAIAAIGAPIITGIGAYASIHAGLGAHGEMNSGAYATALDPLEDQWMMTSVWVAAGAGFLIAAMALAFGKRSPAFAGIFGLIVGAVAGLGYGYYSGMTWMPAG